jgi:hypothetical protein
VWVGSKCRAPWLGGSPDCFLHDPSEENPYGIGEFKCPLSKKDMTIEDACSDSSFFMLPDNDENPRPTLERNHNYYYKVQGLMATCNVEWADFIVYTMEEVNEFTLKMSYGTKTCYLS